MPSCASDRRSGAATYSPPRWQGVSSRLARRGCRRSIVIKLVRGAMTGYAETYRRSLAEPEEFWAEAAEAIDWERRWDRVLDATRPPFYRWFPGARLNTCWNALDRHVGAGRGERVALVWDSPVAGRVEHFTYRELREEVARLAGVLAGLGVVRGDR